MSTEKAVGRLWRRAKQLVRLVSEPGLVGVALHGGNVWTYLRLRDGWLRRLGVRTVVDVGANVGQFADLARRAFPGAELHCFEPIPECFARLQKKFAGNQSVFLYNVAVADASGTGLLIQDSFSPSSSLREMESLHVREFPLTGDGHPVSVAVCTLDAALVNVSLAAPVLVKIDVQGAEDLVIAGGRSTLGAATVAIIETSYESLYKGQPLFDDINVLMQRDGFRYRGNVGELRSPIDGRMLQADAIFVRH